MTIQSVTVINGSAGNIGPPGPPGPSYDATSITSNVISVGLHSFVTQTNLAYLPGARVRVASSNNPDDNWFEGTVSSYVDDTLVVDSVLLSPTRDGVAHSDWVFNIAGEQGQQGAAGLAGTPGTAGNVIWSGVPAPSVTVPPSPTDGDWYLQVDPASPGSTGYLWGPYDHAATNKWGTAGVPLAQGPVGATGAVGPTGPAGATGPQGVQGTPGVVGAAGPPGNVGPAGPTGPGYKGTSLTTFSLLTGSITFTTQAGLAYQVGTRARLAAYAAPTNFEEGLVTAYDSSSGSMTVNVTLVNGSGSYSNWTISVTGEQGQQGIQGFPGPAGSGAGDMLKSENLAGLADYNAARTNMAISAVGHTGNYSDLFGRPNISAVGLTGQWLDILGKPTWAAVAFSGNYADLAGKPTISTVGTTGQWADILGKPTFATVATTGAYNDLSGRPILAPVATSGAYADLTSKPPASIVDAVIPFLIDGAGSAITTGMKGWIEVPFNCTINRATLLADQTGSIVVDIYRTTYANYAPGTHPVSTDKITASTPPTITSAAKAQDATLTSWITSLSAGDILAFNVNSVATIQRCLVSLKVTKT